MHLNPGSLSAVASGACSSPRLHSLPHSPGACSTTSQREHCFIVVWALHPQRLCYTFIFTALTTHTSPPATLAARFISNTRAPAETCSSCLRAAFASTSNLIVGGIPRPFLEISVAHFQPSASTYVVTSLYNYSDCGDACSDRGLPAHLSALHRRNFAPAGVFLLFGH